MTRTAGAAPSGMSGCTRGSVFLAGFMGCGKSTVGSALARRLNWPFADLDAEIERREGCSIPAIFAADGEGGFREREHEALHEQAELSLAGAPRVVALGGGTFAFARNRSLIRRVGIAVWLDGEAALLWERVRPEAHRPLARDRERFRALHAVRRQFYAQADFRVAADGTPSEVLGRVLQLAWMQRLLADA